MTEKRLKLWGKEDTVNFGYFLIALGVLFLMHNFGFIHGGTWRSIIALALLFFGITMIKKSMRQKSPSGQSD